MWLLNSCSWEMKEFISHKQAPPYAILSHTWGDEEVSFRDWQKGPWEEVERNEGFSKIENCCRQAAADGFEWVWIDTCCIDKRSSAELSEAINSMFQWYKNAGVCYAYLYDILDDIELNLAGSRWISRGWTLQELIAPCEIVFYSSDWKSLGTRSELSAYLATVARIDEPFLIGKSRIDEASIAQRMSWAAMRSTSREEDEAYCLLGLFNINMPLIYGEGSKAFRRLQEALVREYPEDHSLFAWGKIVEQLPDQVSYREALKLKPLDRKDSYGEIEDELFGLLAKSPDDFKYAGKVVCAPDTGYYFQSVPTTVSVLAGRTARVDLPRHGEPIVLQRHLQRLPVVQLFVFWPIILLCGQWNDSQTDFYYVTIPIQHSLHSSRLGRIIISDVYNKQRLIPWSLIPMVKTFTIAPLVRPSFMRGGDIIIRRHMSNLAHHQTLYSSKVAMSSPRGLIEAPDSMVGSLISTSYKTNEGPGFLIALVRFEPLDHSHEDSTQGRNCGMLGLRFKPFAPAGKSARKFTILTKEGDSMKPLDAEMTLESFHTLKEACEYGIRSWSDIACGRDMVVPQAEWRLSFIGLANVYISIERVFLDQYVGADSVDDGSHPFVDVLDLVVTKVENSNDRNHVGGGKDTEEVDVKVIYEEDVDEEKAGDIEKTDG
ncbi:HET-domain-containing protein [Xylaria scruposa]|nr:HET-domain-containing protein [Xylaria scruposa]